MTALDDIILSDIPKQWTDELALANTLERFRSLRLFALKNDPDWFGSTYEREVAFSDEQWRERLLVPNALQIAACRPAAESSHPEPSYVTGEWLGLIVPIRIDAAATAEDDRYVINGMFVDPVARGAGLGIKLVNHALDTIRRDRMARCQKPVLVELLVDAANVAALRLYTKCGFQLDAEAPATDSDPNPEVHMWQRIEISDC